jgi:hypothetical protein
MKVSTIMLATASPGQASVSWVGGTSSGGTSSPSDTSCGGKSSTTGMASSRATGTGGRSGTDLNNSANNRCINGTMPTLDQQQVEGDRHRHIARSGLRKKRTRVKKTTASAHCEALRPSGVRSAYGRGGWIAVQSSLHKVRFALS